MVEVGIFVAKLSPMFRCPIFSIGPVLQVQTDIRAVIANQEATRQADLDLYGIRYNQNRLNMLRALAYTA